MPRTRTAEDVYEDIVALIWRRRRECYVGSTITGSCTNQGEWDGAARQIDTLEAEAKQLEAAGKRR